MNEHSDNVSKEETEIEIEHEGKRIKQPQEVATVLNLFLGKRF